MRKAFYCLALCLGGLTAAGYLADTARSDARVTALGGAFSIERASKGDRLPTFAVNAIPREAVAPGEATEAAHNLTVVGRSVPAAAPVGAKAIKVQTFRKDGGTDREALEAARSKKRTKMMDGCEASVSPLSAASAQAPASRCVS